MYNQRRRTISSEYNQDNLSIARKHKGDHWLVVICAGLLAIGLVLIYAIGPALSTVKHVSSTYYTTRQLIAIVLSIIAFIVMANVPIKLLKKYSKFLIAFAAIATLMAIVLPVNPLYPAHRWVRLGSLSFQSVELLKFAVIIWLAGFLAVMVNNDVLKDFRKGFVPLLGVILCLGLIVAGIQSDLGSMLVIVAIIAGMAVVAGLRFKAILYLGVLLLTFIILAITFFPYRVARFETFLHPQANCQTTGYQACQALIAVGSGGISGLGLGKSVQAYGYEPEASNDSIFAIYAETFGFIGSVVLIVIYLALFVRLKKVAERTDDMFSRFVIIGIVAWLSAQAIMNIGAMIGLLPLKGITLPFISYGGTSVVFLAALMGVAFQISRYTSYQKVNISSEGSRRNTSEDFSDRRRIRGTYNSGASRSFRD